jgi:hypothetical protein
MNPEQITTRATIAQLRAGKGNVKPAAKPKRAAAPKHPTGHPRSQAQPGKKR